MSEPKFFPTLALGFIPEANEQRTNYVLHQWWQCETGGGEWRKVPTVSRYFTPVIAERNYPPAEAGTESGESGEEA